MTGPPSSAASESLETQPLLIDDATEAADKVIVPMASQQFHDGVGEYKLQLADSKPTRQSAVELLKTSEAHSREDTL